MAIKVQGITVIDDGRNIINGIGASFSGIITANTFVGSGASLTNIPSGALTNNSVNYGGVTVSLGGTDATPAFDLSDATAYPYTSLTGITTEILGDTTPQLGGNLDLNSKFITGTGGVNVTGVITATEFSGSGASLTDIPNAALTNSSVSYGGVELSLGGTDATPAFDLSDATAYPYTSLTGITTEILGDTTPQLGGNLDINSKFITGTGGINVSGVITATSFDGNITGDITGNADTATSLATARTFELTGDVVASQISFDGTGNVSLAATIQPNSVALGGDTTGDYVSSISGTSNQITVSSGTGEGSTPVISIPNNPTLPGTTVTVATDLQVNRNLNVTGNITIGGTSATLFTETLKISDPDIIVGFRTDINNNDISNDTTASHGGIAIASTEGSPLVSFVGGGGTIPVTYKKIFWFESGAFTGLATDAWLTNYAFGVGTTSMSAGTKFAVGNIETDFDDITSVRHINSSGVVTATTFSGSGANLTSIPNGALTNSSITIGGVTLNLGDTDATPAFNLSDATAYPTSSLVGTITNAQLAGSIANAKLANSTMSVGGVTLTLGATDATPAFDLSDATAYPYTSLTGITTEIVGDTTPQLGGNLDLNSKFITGTGGINVSGVITSTTFSGSGASLTSIPNGALTNSSIAIGGVTLNLGDTDATPAFDLSDATDYPFTSLTGITTEIVGDTTPQLGGNLDFNSKFITGTGGINVSGVVTATSFSGSGTNLTGLTGASAATYGDSSATPVIVVNSDGKITGISTVSISGGGSGGGSIGIQSAGSLIGTASTINFTAGSVSVSNDIASVSVGSSIRFVGARMYNDNYSVTASGSWTAVTNFDGTSIDTNSFANTTNGTFTIPAGVSKVKISTNIRVVANGNTNNQWQIYKNGSEFAVIDGGLNIDIDGTSGYSNPGTFGQTAIISVVEGDYFKLRYFVSNTNLDVDLWYQIEVVEGSLLGHYFASTNVTNADNITVQANNSTNEIVYPVFVDGATGVQGPETDTGLMYNPSTGILSTTTFSGNLPTTDLTGTITNAQLAGSIANAKLVNDSVSFGGVSVDLGASDATPAFNLSDATAYPTSSLVGTITNAQLAGSIADAKLASTFLKNVVEDTTPQLGGNLDFNSKFITGTGGINVSGVVTATSFSGSGSALTGLTGASAATYGDSSATPVIVVNSDGKITGISTVTISGGGGGDTVSITSNAADILSVSSGAISADDAGADKIVFWDDTEGKLTYLTVGTNLSISGTTISASGGGGSGPDPVIMGMIF
jgi:hypothetical protein